MLPEKTKRILKVIEKKEPKISSQEMPPLA